MSTDSIHVANSADTEVSAITAAVREAFPFGITIQSLTGPEGIPTPHKGLFQVVDGEFGPEIGECCSSYSPKEGYIPHQTDDVAAICDAVSPLFQGKNGDPKILTRWDDGHQVLVKPSDSQRIRLFEDKSGEDDDIWPRLMINASLAGKAYTVRVGLYRDACKNLEMIRSVNECSVSIRHDVNLRYEMDKLIEQCACLKDGWAAMEEHVQMMSQRDINFAAFMQEILPPPERGESTQYRNSCETIWTRLCQESQRFGVPQPEPEKANAWLAFNAVTYFTQHKKSRNGLRELGAEDVSIQRAFRGFDDPLAVKAEATATRLALAAA